MVVEVVIGTPPAPKMVFGTGVNHGGYCWVGAVIFDKYYGDR